MTSCPHDPVTMKGKPIGMYHCVWCGCMVLAGLPHSACEPECDYQDDADREVWERAARGADGGG